MISEFCRTAGRSWATARANPQGLGPSARAAVQDQPGRTGREHQPLSLPQSQGVKPCWSRLGAPATQALRQPVIHPPAAGLACAVNRDAGALAQVLTLAAANPDWLAGLSQARAHMQFRVPQTP